MPRTPEEFERIRAESREKILDSALELFARHGFAGTPVRTIAESAGVSQGLLYNYFEGKAGLLRAIFERGSVEVRGTLEAAEAARPSEALAVLVRAAFDAVRRNREFWKLTYQLRMQPDVMADVGPEIVARAGRIRRRIEELLERAGIENAGVRATLLFAAVDGTAQHYVLDPDRYPLDAVASELIERLGAPGDGSPATELPP